MSAPILRNYQLDIANKALACYGDKKRCVLVQAATGAGKTIIFSYMTHGASQKGNVVVLLAHRREIVKQISMSLAKFSVKHQLIADSDTVAEARIAQTKKYLQSFVDKNALIIVGMVQTLGAKLDIIGNAIYKAKESNDKAKLFCIVDEAHHCVENTAWGKVMEFCLGLHNGLGLLVSATPQRLDGKGLGKEHAGYADAIVLGPPVKWLIANGFLSKYKIFGPEIRIETDGVKKQSGDFASSSLTDKANKPIITGNAIQLWNKHAKGLKTVIFCVSVQHSLDVAKAFNEAGIATAHVDGKTKSKERTEAIKKFADGELQILTQVNLFTEGFDLSSIAEKDVTIDCVIDLAPTLSLIYAMQRWGRALRPAPGKIAIILDCANNVERHEGGPSRNREWSLEGLVKKKKQESSTVEKVFIKTCPKCFCIHDPLPTCPECGHVYEIKSRKIENIDGDLVEIDESKLEMEIERKKLRREQGRAQTLEELLTIEKSRGFKKGWAQIIYRARQAKQKES
jgi:superfamily II DNA or RNA helicase